MKCAYIFARSQPWTKRFSVMFVLYMYGHGQAPLLYQNYVSDAHPMSLDTVGQSVQCITPSGARTDTRMSCHVIENNFSCV